MNLKDQKSLRLTVSIAIVIFLLTLLITYLTTSGMDVLIPYVSGWLKYKTLLLSTILLLFAWLISIFYYRKLIEIVSIKQVSENPDIKNDFLTDDELIEQYKYFLNNLSKDEKIFLKYYIDNDTKTQYAEISDGVAQGLFASKILFRASNISHSYRGIFPYNIQPLVWEYLKKHPKILK